MASTSREFREGDLVWAKMKGYPPWPAKVLPFDFDAVMPGRLKVLFFGTKETAFLKTNELYDYKEFRGQFEIPRKHKDFKEAVEEVRIEAGFAVPTIGKHEVKIEPEDPAVPSTSTGRKRLNSSKLFFDAFVGEQQRKRALSDGSSSSKKTRSRTDSVASFLKHLRKKRRLGSESSGGSKQKQLMISGGFNEKDILENYLAPLNELPILEGELGFSEVDTKSKKSGRSRCSSNFITELSLTIARQRQDSGSNNGRNRTRTISGISEIYEDILGGNSKFLPEAFLDMVNEYSSGEEDGPATPEGPSQMPTIQKRCSDCDCACALYGVKWRCTNKGCLKWNGIAEGYLTDVNGSSTTTTTGRTTRGRLNSGRVDDEAMRAAQAIMSPASRRSSESTTSALLHKWKKPKPKKSTALTLDNLDAQIPQSPEKSSMVNVKLEPDDIKPTLSKRGRSPIKSKNRDYYPHARIKQEEPTTGRGRENRRKVDRLSPERNSPNAKRPPGRPSTKPKPDPTQQLPVKIKTYKVEKTPPIGPSGARECIFCKGQVRPQMCGGSKHRWRCVDKKCRKWYGWVRANEVVPEVYGKKRNVDDKDGSADDGKRDPDDPSHNNRQNHTKEFAMKIRLRNSMKKGMIFKDEAARIQRKYAKKRGDADAEFFYRRDPPSPLTERQMGYHASSMERRSRWWTGEKRKADASPVRAFKTGVNDVAATFRIMAHAMRSAAVTRADEPGTVAGTLDLLMDSLIASFPALFSLLQKLPKMKQDDAVMQKIWNASAVHTPIFQ
ncbi:unnamed protein product, partial [Mesorhabditis spiculigera]